VIIGDMRSSMVAAHLAAIIVCAHDLGLDSCSHSEQPSDGVASTPFVFCAQAPEKFYSGA